MSSENVPIFLCKLCNEQREVKLLNKLVYLLNEFYLLRHLYLKSCWYFSNPVGIFQLVFESQDLSIIFDNYVAKYAVFSFRF
jgi:hypothetical protein